MRVAPLVLSVVLAIGLAIASLDVFPERLVWNGSPSAPRGLYWIDHAAPQRGDFVVARVPEEMRDLVVERGYLPPDIGLLKRVAALDGDQVCRFSAQIVVNGRPVAEAQSEDFLGQDMPVWRGCRTLQEDDIFLLQSHPWSFDGRYFGVSSRASVMGRARLLVRLDGDEEHRKVSDDDAG